MQKLANISEFEGLQSRTGQGGLSPVGVFNARAYSDRVKLSSGEFAGSSALLRAKWENGKLTAEVKPYGDGEFPDMENWLPFPSDLLLGVDSLKMDEDTDEELAAKLSDITKKGWHPGWEIS